MITNQTAVASIQRFPGWISRELYKTNGKKLDERFCKDNVVFQSFLSQERLGCSAVHTKSHQFNPKKTKHVVIKQHKVAWGPLRRYKPMTGNPSFAMISTAKRLNGLS